MSSATARYAILEPGLIRFAGEDAQAFLQNQLTCDVNALTPGRSAYGSYCTPKGRILASFLLWRSADGFVMQLPSSLREPMQKQLSKFILRSKVKAADVTGDWVVIGAAGTDAVALARKVAGQAPGATNDVVLAEGMTVIRLPTDRCEIVVAREKAAGVLAALAQGAEKADAEYWGWLDIRAGVPWILPATQEAFVPQMVNLDLIGGVSFEKGCYPGQEIVARMHYRGTLKQRMYLASAGTAGQPQPGDKLYSPDFGEQACGTIANAARSPEGGYDALAVIQIASVEKGDVRWNAPDGPTLKFLPLPYQVTSDG